MVLDRFHIIQHLSRA
ncbi:hypothetical protein, partial [Streptococcus suis]